MRYTENGLTETNNYFSNNIAIFCNY